MSTQRGSSIAPGVANCAAEIKAKNWHGLFCKLGKISKKFAKLKHSAQACLLLLCVAARSLRKVRFGETQSVINREHLTFKIR